MCASLLNFLLLGLSHGAGMWRRRMIWRRRNTFKRAWNRLAKNDSLYWFKIRVEKQRALGSWIFWIWRQRRSGERLIQVSSLLQGLVNCDTLPTSAGRGRPRATLVTRSKLMPKEITLASEDNPLRPTPVLQWTPSIPLVGLPGAATTSREARKTHLVTLSATSITLYGPCHGIHRFPWGND